MNLEKASPISNHTPMYNIIIFTVLILTSCVATKGVDRKAIPTIDKSVPSNVSEIREIMHKHSRREEGHKDLHIEGRIFTKSQVNGKTEIASCNNCLISLTNASDTSVQIKFNTETDGYFSYKGKMGAYNITIENPGMNKMELGVINFFPEGTTFFTLINASGNKLDKFYISQNGTSYAWSRY